MLVTPRTTARTTSRDLPRRPGVIATTLRPALVAGGIVAALAAVAFVTVGRLWPTPFETVTIDRSTPPVLLELRDLAEFHAAEGQFSVVIDTEDDVRWVPSALAGERVQYVAVGSVDAVVDFGAIDHTDVRVTGSTVRIVLPPATLAEPRLDLSESHVLNRDRGLLNRIGGVFSDSPTSEAMLQELAVARLADAAAATELARRAEANTTAMLTSMLTAMGFEQVIVRFVDSIGVVAAPTP
jgi:hypothetical protein